MKTTIPEYSDWNLIIFRGFTMFNTKQLWTSRRQALGLTAVRSADERSFWNHADNLKSANKMLLRFVLKHPAVTDVPGFDMWFALFKLALAQFPQPWFISG